MKNDIKILVLEDDLETLSVLMGSLYKLETELFPISIAITVFSEYNQVEDYINKLDKQNFDIVLLDRDCHRGGSFHVLDFSKFKTDKIISISTNPEWNDEAVKHGVKHVCWKDHENIEEWGERMFEIIKKIILKNKSTL